MFRVRLLKVLVFQIESIDEPETHKFAQQCSHNDSTVATVIVFEIKAWDQSKQRRQVCLNIVANKASDVVVDEIEELSVHDDWGNALQDLIEVDAELPKGDERVLQEHKLLELTHAVHTTFTKDCFK